MFRDFNFSYIESWYIILHSCCFVCNTLASFRKLISIERFYLTFQNQKKTYDSLNFSGFSLNLFKNWICCLGNWEKRINSSFFLFRSWARRARNRTIMKHELPWLYHLDLEKGMFVSMSLKDPCFWEHQFSLWHRFLCTFNENLSINKNWTFVFCQRLTFSISL